MERAPSRQTPVAAFLCALLQQNPLQFDEIVKTTSEEQVLLNIVRLRYTDPPSSLSVSTIAAQFERSQNLAIVPFFTAGGADSNRSYAAVLPQASVARPIELTGKTGPGPVLTLPVGGR